MDSDLYRWLVFIVTCVIVGGWLFGCVGIVLYILFPRKRGFNG